MSRSIASRFAAAIVLFAPTVHAATVSVRQTIVERQSIPGRYDAAYPTGVDGSTLAWGTCPNQQWVVGDSCAVNLRTVCSLTGTNALTATLSKLSGTLPSGCSAGTDGITGTVGGAQASNQVVWEATDGTSSVTAPFTVEAVAAPAGDTTAPTIPTNCSGTPGSGLVTIACDPSSDPYVGEAGSGVASYRIYRNGSLVSTKAAPSANIQQELAGMTVGSADGTQSATQTGANRAMSGGGAGLGSTTDQLYAVGYPVTGDFIATARVASFAGAVSTGTAGLMARVSNAVDSAYTTCRSRDSDDKVNMRRRDATDGSASNGTLTAALGYPQYLRLVASAGTYQCQTSVDGLTYTATDAARAISLGSAPYVLAFHASGTAETNSTSQIDQISITTDSAWSQDVTTSVGGDWTVTAVDAEGNESAASTAFAASPIAASCTGTSDIETLHADDFEYGSNGEPVDRTPATNGNDGAYVNNAARWTTSDDINATYDEPPLISTVHARNGTRSMRTSITYHNGTVFHTMPNGQTPHRNEVSTKNSTADGFANPTDARVIGGHYWFAFSLWLPGDADTDAQTGETDAFSDPKMPAANYPPGQRIFWQLKNANDACDNVASNPTLQFDYGYLGNDQTQPREHLRINLQHARSNHTQNCQGDPSAATFPSGFNSSTYTGNTAPFGHAVTTLYTEDWRTDRGQWVDWIIHWSPDYDNDGILQIWKVKAGTTTEIVRRQGPTMQRDAKVNGAIKIGQYMGGAGGWGISASPTVYPSKTVVYHDDLIQAVANGASGFAETTDCAFRAVSPAND